MGKQKIELEIGKSILFSVPAWGRTIYAGTILEISPSGKLFRIATKDNSPLWFTTEEYHLSPVSPLVAAVLDEVPGKKSVERVPQTDDEENYWKGRLKAYREGRGCPG